MDWREKLFGRLLVKCDAPGTQNGKFETVPTLEALADCVEDGEGAVCGIYFSFANISDTSDDFGVRLEEVYRRVYSRLKVVEVVLWAHVGTPEGPVEREAGFRRSLTGKPWFAVPFHDVDTKVGYAMFRIIQCDKVACSVYWFRISNEKTEPYDHVLSFCSSVGHLWSFYSGTGKARKS